jgi:hypothetical protein
MNRWTTGDVLEWAEPDWFKKGKRKPEFFKKGERLLTAQITSMDKTYVHLEVLRCELLSDQSATGVKMLKPGEGIVRKHATLKAREAKRIPWGGPDGEAARKAVTRFLRPPPR